MLRPSDWRGQRYEDATRFAAERATGDWWRQNWIRLKIAEVGMWALLLMGCLAAVTIIHAAQGIKADAEAEFLRARQRREQWEARLCREWPKWCREERASWAAGR